MNLVILAGAAGVALLAGALLATAKDWRPTLWALGVVLTISPSALASKVPALGDETVFKAAVVGLLALLGLRLGIRVRWPVAVLLAALLLALTISVVPLTDAIAVDRGFAAKAFAGFLLTPLAMTIRWQRVHVPDVLQVLVALPVVSVVLGVVLQGAGLWLAVSDGRLGGALIGPSLALLSIAAAFAAFGGLVLLGQRRWAIWLLADCGIAFLTLTRGALLAAGVLVVALVVWTVRARRTAPRPALTAARRVIGLVVVVAMVALPFMLVRSEGNAYEGSFNTSGRDRAWPFYLSLSANAPLTGRGLGYANIANALLKPIGVQSEFESPHNEYIHLWVDGGLLLAVPWFGALIALAIVVHRTTRRPELAYGVLGATLVYCFVDNNFSTPQFGVVTGLVLAALLAHRVEAAPPAALLQASSLPVSKVTRARAPLG